MIEIIKKLINISIWVFVILFCARCLLSFEDIKNNLSFYNIFGYAGEMMSLTLIIIILYEKILWKKLPYKNIPVLYKKYYGYLKSSYDNIERPISVEINQTLLTTKITLISNESRSKTVASSVINDNGENLLIYSYLNTPKIVVRNRSEIHYGTTILYIHDPNKINGFYFTDRNTRGDIELQPENISK